MNIIILSLGFIITIQCSCFADQYVNGYAKSDGTYVQGYYRSSPDATVQDNYNYKGNANPYTGQVGDNYYRSNPTSQYYGGQNNQPSQDDRNNLGSHYNALNTPMNPNYSNNLSGQRRSFGQTDDEQ